MQMLMNTWPEAYFDKYYYETISELLINCTSNKGCLTSSHIVSSKYL